MALTVVGGTDLRRVPMAPTADGGAVPLGIIAEGGGLHLDPAETDWLARLLAEIEVSGTILPNGRPMAFLKRGLPDPPPARD